MLDSGFIMYEGPYPPADDHTYHFTIYALDTTLSLTPSTATRTNVLAAMAGHILDEAVLTGTHAAH